MEEVLNQLLDEGSCDIERLLKLVPTASTEQPSFRGFPIHVVNVLADRKIYFLGDQGSPEDIGFHMSPTTYERCFSIFNLQ